MLISLHSVSSSCPFNEIKLLLLSTRFPEVLYSSCHFYQRKTPPFLCQVFYKHSKKIIPVLAEKLLLPTLRHWRVRFTVHLELVQWLPLPKCEILLPGHSFVFFWFHHWHTNACKLTCQSQTIWMYLSTSAQPLSFGHWNHSEQSLLASQLFYYNCSCSYKVICKVDLKFIPI